MTLLVVDASVAAAFLIPSQATERAASLFTAWAEHRPVAPYVFALEVPWLLLKRERQTASLGFARRQLAALRTLEIQLADPIEPDALGPAFDTSERYRIGLYDAHYVLLALEAEAALATKDSGMIRAASLFGVDVLDVR